MGQRSAFLSWEFIIYYIIIASTLTYHFVDNYHVNWDKPRQIHRVWPDDRTWTFKKSPADMSDHQWNMWRNNFPVLFTFFSIWTLASVLLKKLFPNSPNDQLNPDPSRHSLGKMHIVRTIFYPLSGLIFIYVLHGRCMIYWGMAVMTLYLVAKLFGHIPVLGALAPWAVLVPWFLGVYRLDAMRLLGFLGLQSTFVGTFVQWVNQARGQMGWSSPFNVTTLRLVSFALDYHWSFRGPRAEREAQARVHAIAEPMTLKARERMSLPRVAYGLLNYITYASYAPLYIGGPIITYNAFVSQLLAPPSSASAAKDRAGSSFKAILRAAFTDVHSWAYKVTYLLRVLLWTVFTDVYTHVFWATALLVGSDEYQHAGALEMSRTFFLACCFTYLKFYTIFRFFRAWSNLDGIMTWENQPRCFVRGSGFAVFWRTWHVSLNRWNIRYLYVPAKGYKYPLVSVWMVFFFIAFWHEPTLEWVRWAAGNAAGLVIETVIVKLATSDKRPGHEGGLIARLKQHHLLWTILGTCCNVVASFALPMVQVQTNRDWSWTVDTLRKYFTGPGALAALAFNIPWHYATMRISNAIDAAQGDGE
ncbi:putative membrane-bound O-acyltransferase family MBOAT protein [Paratrimastix pyriformis]|uniref:Membrane-bound O-acyltransferase family MBOAT protein n=1 Tax=Paratrimastix pyriformis TaxID=342808 RepID=A0ABQ8UVV3_9EUKA|nr:putative membrane-bound O-acyltransferase family MBOAT protein [Paratrimastix pyriformis]